MTRLYTYSCYVMTLMSDQNRNAHLQDTWVALSLLGFSSNFPCRKHDLPSSVTWLFCKFNWNVIDIIVLCIVSKNNQTKYESAYLQDFCEYRRTVAGAIRCHYSLKEPHVLIECVKTWGSQKYLACPPTCSYTPFCLT